VIEFVINWIYCPIKKGVYYEVWMAIGGFVEWAVAVCH